MALPRNVEAFILIRAEKRVVCCRTIRDGDVLIPLSEDDEVEGFRVGDRIAYAGGCYSHLCGKNATVIGFSNDRRVWTQPDGGTACHWTPEKFAKRDLVKINN